MTAEDSSHTHSQIQVDLENICSDHLTKEPALCHSNHLSPRSVFWMLCLLCWLLGTSVSSCSRPLTQQDVLQSQRDGYDLPAHDALAQILQDYQHLLKVPKAPQHSRGEPRGHEKSQKSSELNQTFEIHNPHDRFPVTNAQNDGPHVAAITEHQTKEVENCRHAMRKMAEDILALRSQVASLEEENTRLRSEVSMHQNLSHTLLHDTDTDVMTKAEIADRIVSLKLKLANESSKVAEQREKIQQLQNELIRKNDSEKELLELQRAHRQQQAELQHHQDRARKLPALQATVRQQEKVIERMEKVLETKMRERNKENSERKKIKQRDKEENTRRDTEFALAVENSHLREELEKLRQPPPVLTKQPSPVDPTQQPLTYSERMNLSDQLERAEASVRTLNKQLEENARQWGREKQEMLTRLSEYDHGFVRTPSVILHDSPLKNDILGHARHRRLEPLKRFNAKSQ